MFQVWKKLSWFFKKYRKNLFIAMLSSCVMTVFFSYIPYMIGNISDAIKYKTLSADEFKIDMIKFFAVIILTYAVSSVQEYFTLHNMELMDRELKLKIFKKILTQSPNFFVKHNAGDLMANATNDIDTMDELAGYGLMSLFDCILFPIVVFAMLASISWSMLAVVALSVPIYLLLLNRISRRLDDYYKSAHEAFADLNGTTLENVTGIRVIKAFSVQNIFLKRFRTRSESAYKKNIRASILSQSFLPVAMIYMAIITAISLAVGLKLIATGELTTGGLISVFMYINMLTYPLFSVSDLTDISRNASASIDRIEEVLNYEEEIVETDGAIEFEDKQGIEFKDFYFKYSDGSDYALKDINLKIPKGKTIGIVGKTGSGKTTLIKQLFRFYNFDRGDILLDGKSILNYRIGSVRDKLGYVPQENFLFSRSVEDNVSFFSGKNFEHIKEATELADVARDIEGFGKGYETMAGEKGISLSGGQKQRISIARALLIDPDILILDDSLSSVDSKTEKNILNNIKRLREGKTTVISAHRLSIVAHADEIIVMDGGRIIERGTHEGLYEKGGWYREQYDVQTREEATGNEGK